jgi:hypothetical protein
MRNFFMGIDTGIIEAARIDGANEWKILFSIVMPMSKAVTAVIALFYGVGFWNAFFNAVLYIDDSSKWPLQMVLRQYVLQGQSIPGVNFTVAQGANLDCLSVCAEALHKGSYLRRDQGLNSCGWNNWGSRPRPNLMLCIRVERRKGGPQALPFAHSLLKDSSCLLVLFVAELRRRGTFHEHWSQ